MRKSLYFVSAPPCISLFFPNKSILFLIFSLLIFLSPAKAIFYNNPNWNSGDNNYTMSVAAGDMDNDGYCDLVAGNYKYPYTSGDINSNNASALDTEQMGGNVAIYWNSANGLDTTPDYVWTSSSMGVDKVVLADMNNDGDLDIVVGTVAMKGYDARCFILDNGGPQGFNQIEDNYWPSEYQDTHDLAVGDIDNDGDMDIITAGVCGDVLLWLQGPHFTTNYTEPGLNSAVLIFPYDLDKFDYDSLNTFPGMMVELGDLTGDGRLDLIINTEGKPTFFINTGNSPYFSLGSSYKACLYEGENDKDPASCGAIGRYYYYGQWRIIFAAGTIRHTSSSGDYEMRGCNLYCYDTRYEPPFQEIVRTIPMEGMHYTLDLDIQMGDINGDGYMDLVTGAYPTLNDEGDGWQDGYAQCVYLDSTNAFTTDTVNWHNFNNFLTTSIALGQFNSDNTVIDTLIFNFTGSPSDTFLKYFELFPIDKVTLVKDIEGDTIPLAKYT